MREIPDDIMRVAETCITDVSWDAWEPGDGDEIENPEQHVILCIARAILAERKRCVDVALREGDKTEPAVGYLIAKAIEAGQ